MLVSRDLDCTNTLYIQFSFKFITKGQTELQLNSRLKHTDFVRLLS